MSTDVAERRSPSRVAFAWGVHAFTASGGVVGLAALLAAGAGDLRAGGLLMLVALVIDSVDGTLARAARVTEVLPGIDGRRLELGRQQSLEAIPVELGQEIQHLCATHMVGRRWNAARPYGAVGAQMVVEAQALVQRGALP